jgi:hypothetical protein
MAFKQYDKGYDVSATGQRDAPGARGRLYFPWPGPNFIKLWVTGVTIDFGLAGNTAQSRSTRSFFPHNSIPPTITVACIAPNQYQYGKTLEFVREQQQGAITSGDFGYLHIFGGGISNAGFTHKGVHDPIAAEGYVQTARRRHVAHEYAPEFTLAFIVSRMAAPFGADKVVPVKKLIDWHQIVNKIIKDDPNVGFAEDPDAHPRPTSDPPTVPDVPQAPGANGQIRPL